MKKNKVILIGVFIAITGLFLQFVYLPKAIHVKKLGAEYKNIKASISGLYTFIGGENNLKDNLIEMRSYAADLENAFPSEKEASNIIKQLNDEAASLKINVISIKPGSQVNYTDSRGAQLKAFDYACKAMPMELKVEARYHGLGNFLQKIELDKNPMIAVRRVHMQKDVNILPKIKADVELSACVLGEDE